MRLRHALIALAFTVACGPTLGADKMPSITVHGTGEVGVVPDEVVLTISVETYDPKLDTAKRANDDSVARVQAIAKNAGIAARDIQTRQTSFEIVREASKNDDRDDSYGYHLRYTRPVMGYLVERSLVMRLTDLRRFEALYAALITVKDCTISQTLLSTSRQREYRDAARTLALKAAREKAVAMAQALGQTVGQAIDIKEESDRNWGMSNSSVSAEYVLDDTGIFSPGQLRVQASVTVVFALD